jgi:hypothetical protein
LIAASAIGSADGFLPKEDAMKKWMMMVALLSLCACAGVSRAWAGSRDDALSGTWRGVVRKGLLESVVYFEFARTGAGYRGEYWGGAPVGAPVALSSIELGHSIQFEIPQMGVFHGEIVGETIEGTFEDANGSGSFRLEKQPVWEVPQT